MLPVTVTDDDPDGFADLRDAYTLFAESRKKDNAEQRGRFNVGDKLVLATARSATISTTTGTMVFDPEGRHFRRMKRAAGSQFTGVLLSIHFVTWCGRRSATGRYPQASQRL
jgi:hypothetical protein